MRMVGEYYNAVQRKYGKDIAHKFYELMKEWDGSTGTWNSFYDEDVLGMKLKEAWEWNKYA